MTLSEWAKRQGITYKTAWRWFKAGALPVPYRQLPSGTIPVHPSDVGSGLNGHRPKLMKLLADRDVPVIVVEHRDRLTHFGSESIEATLAASGRKLVVVDTGEMTDDLVQDMIDMLTNFRARLYAWRSAKNRALKAVAATQEEPA